MRPAALASAAAALILLASRAPAQERLCREAPLPELLRQAGALSQEEQGRLDHAEFLVPAMYHFACRAVAAGGGEACAALAKASIRIPGGRSLEWNCRMRHAEALLIRAVTRGDPAAEDLCESFLKDTFSVAPGRRRILCKGILEADKEARGALCREILGASGRQVNALRTQGCLSTLALVRGEAVDCDDLSGRDWLPMDQPFCRAAQAFRSAHAAGKAELCGSQALCLAMMGSAERSCGDYAEQSRLSYCVQRFRGESPASLASAEDGVPQPARFAYLPRDLPALYFHPAAAHHHGGGHHEAQETFTDLGRQAYAYLEGGEIHPPKPYQVSERYSKADVERFKRALKVAHRYSDVNAAFADGFRLEDKFDAGMGIHMHHLGRIMDPEVAVEKPEFLTYVLNGATGRLQLMQLGYIHRGHSDLEPYRLFDTPEAKGHFHTQMICVRVERNVIVDVPDSAGCRKPGELAVAPIWMMHLAVNVYNENGLFSDYFPYLNHLSREGLTFSFYGEPVKER